MRRISPLRLHHRRCRRLLICLLMVLAIGFSFYSTTYTRYTAKAQDAIGTDESMRLSERSQRQIEALIAAKKARTPTQRKIDSHLLDANKIRRGEPVAEGIFRQSTGVETDEAGRVLVDINASVSPELLKQIEAAGGEVVNSFPGYDAIRARVLLEQIEVLAGLAGVHFIHPAFQGDFLSGRSKRPPSLATSNEVSVISPIAALTKQTARRSKLRNELNTFLKNTKLEGRTPLSVGSFQSEGDKTHLADTARAIFGVDGTGIKIGVLSDSIDHLAAAQASGNLGTVFVLSGQDGVNSCGKLGNQPCSGEGTAMLEIIHDLAPGAQLFFATANGGPIAFAQNIRNLRNVAHCDIIVDDFLPPNETPFQDGQTTPSNTNGGAALQAVNEVTASGALYFSSAGNSGNLDDGTSGVWEGDFVDGGQFILDGQPAGRIHSFGPSLFNTITSQAGVILYWSDPLGAALNDYDFYVLDANGTVIDQGDNFQNGQQDPYEEGEFSLPPGARVVIVKFSGAGRFLHLDTSRGRLSIATAGQVRGHSCAADAFSVAATPAFTAEPGDFLNPSGPFPNSFSFFNLSERFSSDGPRRMFFAANGAAFTPGNFSSTGGIVRITPDITAADGVGTSDPHFRPFFGTSAAAPHAAAIAALLKSFKPSLTPAQVRTVLTSTAIDIEAPGIDRNTGVGIVMAFQALKSVATPNLTPFKPTGWSDKIVVSNVAGTNTDNSPLLTTNNLLVDLAVANLGTTSTGSGFFVKLFVDNVERSNFVIDPLSSNFFVFVEDQSIGSLSAGTHTIKIIADPSGAVAETNESDNEFTKTITVSTPTTGSTVQLNASSQSVTETLNQTTKVNILLTRTGSTSGSASVSYATSDLTANERSDYVAAVGTARFAPGETSKTITVFIVDDRFGEGAESFLLTLSNPIGCTLGSLASTTVIINSNETVNGSNPVKDATFNSDFFVRQHYVDFLNREADSSGLAFWKNEIDSCTTQACREVRRVNVSAAFFVSIEFQQTGYLVYKTYQAAFNSGELLKLRDFLSDTQEIGRGVVIGQPGADALLEANKQRFFNDFVQRASFLTPSAYPTTLTATQFVDKLNANTFDPRNPAGGSLTQSERNSLIAQLSPSPSSATLRAQVLRSIAENSLFNTRQFNKAFVLTQYFGYLRRNPNDAPDNNFNGYNFWLGKLNQFNGNFVAAEMVKAFITATEYQQRFGP